MTIRSPRGEIYFTLSELFKPPVHDFVFQLHGGEVKRKMDSWLHSVCEGFLFPSLGSEPATPEELFIEMKGEYHSLFEGPIIPFAPLIESVYKPWDKDGSSIVGTAHGHIMGYPALDMKRRYEMRGIEIPTEYSHALDHLTLLLEFFAIEIEVAPAGELDEFAKSHLDWIEAFVKEALKTGKAQRYQPIMEFMGSFIKKDAFHAGFALGGDPRCAKRRL
ncbi:MAG: molecular chaperone TorD family protein [Nitrospinae bacterium]|nr:molecular chaperone TorD family protein [Nitrospinota bacterium]MBF0633222.1 molecular chaperone TorD family protein [Nitrospinota bacterium]